MVENETPRKPLQRYSRPTERRHGTVRQMAKHPSIEIRNQKPSMRSSETDPSNQPPRTKSGEMEWTESADYAKKKTKEHTTSYLAVECRAEHSI